TPEKVVLACRPAGIAGDLFAELVKRRPNNLDLLLAHGRYLIEAGDSRGADAAFTAAAKLTPNELNRFLAAGWWVVGPYLANLTVPFAPERNPDPSRPVAAGSGPGELRWHSVTPGADGSIDLKSVAGPESWSAYALALVYSPVERSA